MSDPVSRLEVTVARQLLAFGILLTSVACVGDADLVVQQRVATLELLPADTTIMFTAQLEATARDGRSNPVAAAEVTWTSDNPSIASVSSTGLVTAVSLGTTAIRASVDDVTAQSVITVTEPQSFSDLIPEFPLVHTAGNILVASDIGASFSEQHAVHLKTVWDYFDSVFVRGRGDRLDMYYSSDRSKLLKALELCPTQPINEPEARVLTACYGDHGYGIWFVEPIGCPEPSPPPRSTLRSASQRVLSGR